MIAALESTRFVPFAFPPSKPLFYNSNTRWPAKTSRSIRSLNTSGSQKIRRPVATLSRSGCQAEADRNTPARVEGRKPALANSDDESDDDIPSLEELSRTASRPETLDEETELTLQRLDQPALDGAGMQADRTKLGLGERQGKSVDQPVNLDDDESDGARTGDETGDASSDIETGRVKAQRWPRQLTTMASFDDKADWERIMRDDVLAKWK